ncbi:hypothetical protein I8748_34595 [Nostoc sp. CENA67]|uniref:Uncharacterized protein n=1 Tax=Amazonocrinis nigriterrae CENA67 TaxID=2794033 RepID=A0A8J7HWJ4_9NOST|nr:hypothetical protein [Amazonocrinis nigriterrae]MBH8561655.1 hypothetical protein [Amazonocrinis nigriterrae CENA67]MBH8567222.1 hypothetical protein [Amazonocrinis nigriterrae CENA67]
MVTKNGEISQSQTQGIWTDQEERKPSNDGRWDNGTRQPGGEIGCQSLSSSRIDWTRTDPPVSTGDDPLGGTVQQLIADTREEILEIEIRGEKLRQRLTSLEELSERLKENPVKE